MTQASYISVASTEAIRLWTSIERYNALLTVGNEAAARQELEYILQSLKPEFALQWKRHHN